MAAFKLNLFIEQGASFEQPGIWEAGDPLLPVDLTHFRAHMQIRADVDSPNVLLDLTTENGRIVLGGTAGTISIKLDAETTAAIDWDFAVYDLKLIDIADSTSAIRFMAGRVFVSRGVTR